MALSLITKAWPIVMQTGRKFVLVALCDAANDDGACFMCVETIAYKCGMGVRTVQGHLIDLEATGFIWRDARLGRSSIYSVNVVVLEDAEKNPLWVKRQLMKRTPAKTAGVSKTPADSAPPPAEVAGAPAEPAPIPVSQPSPIRKNNNKARQCVLPDGFMPNKTAEAMASEMGLDIAAELSAFQDHHAANGSTFKDWQAAFRTWLRNAVRFARREVTSRPAFAASGETAYQRSMRERVAEVAPAIARKAPGAPAPMQAVEFFNTVEAAPALRIGSNK